ncbi:MAG: tRNA pseudouridine13 synthase [Thermoplasmata archaeon]|jgi:tRNA pseudouridine13 synthase|nr:tRNA pseudouridine13 synthase [Thermoplasmata archaeon]
MGDRPLPPDSEQALGLRSYLSGTPGIGGRLRSEPEDFRVIELGPGPAPLAEGAYTAARVELRNWETNRFAMQAARELGIPREHVAFAGMKDKRAVTEQWFTFKAAPAALDRLASLGDVTVLERHATRKASFTGAHEGNRFVLRVRGSSRDRAAVEGTFAAIRANGGVPNFFGPQRFGGHFRPVTHLVGKALVEGDLEEACRLYLGHPMPGEREEARNARRVYEETRDPSAALAAYPPQLDPERDMLRRLQKRPGDWRYSLLAHPMNLLLLFVHAHQSLLFNEILSARVAAGLGLNTAQVGDRVMGMDEEGIRTHLVTAANRARVQKELDLGRATLTALLPGMAAPLAEGEPGQIEQDVLDDHNVDLADFRIRELPELASDGRRRGILQPVRGLAVEWVEAGDGGADPVFSFALGKGSYATVVMREFMKGDGADS